MVSDSEPDQFLESLDHHFPQSKKVIAKVICLTVIIGVQLNYELTLLLLILYRWELSGTQRF